jgi:RimJ/RimL family protein N-acetyltransferase
MQRFDTIATGRLILRRWKDEDRAPFAALNGDPETLAYFPRPSASSTPASPAAARCGRT